jgi:hypothetical protein
MSRMIIKILFNMINTEVKYFIECDTLLRISSILKHIGIFINFIINKLYINIKHLKIIRYKYSFNPNSYKLFSDAQ